MTARDRVAPRWCGHPLIWLLTVGLFLAACGSPTPPTATNPAATKPSASPVAAAPTAAATTSAPTTTSVPATTAPAPTTNPGTPTRPPATALAAATPRPASPTTAPAGAVRAEFWQIDGKPVRQVALTSDRRRYATTATGLYLATGDQVEQRASGDWPNLIATGGATLLSGDHPPCGPDGPGATLQRSVDGGKSWQAVQAAGVRGALTARPVQTLGGALFALTCSEVFWLADTGATWQRLTVVPTDQQVIDVATTPDGAQLYMVALLGEGGTTRLQVTQRQADGWAPVRTLREDWGGGVVSLGREANQLVLYFATPLGVQISRDGGGAWQTLNQGLDSTLLLADPRLGNLPAAEEEKLRRGVGVYSISPTFDRGRTLLGGADGVYQLQDGRWQKLPVLDAQIVREVFFDLDNLGHARTDLGVFRLRGL